MTGRVRAATAVEDPLEWPRRFRCPAHPTRATAQLRSGSVAPVRPVRARFHRPPRLSPEPRDSPPARAGAPDCCGVEPARSKRRSRPTMHAWSPPTSSSTQRVATADAAISCVRPRRRARCRWYSSSTKTAASIRTSRITRRLALENCIAFAPDACFRSAAIPADEDSARVVPEARPGQVVRGFRRRHLAKVEVATP